MTIQEHKDLTSRSWNNQDKETNILHATLIISSEAGELVSAIKKKVGYQKDIDLVNVKEELGDIIYGVQRLMIELDLTWEEILIANIEKLKARYPDKFNQDKAINRDLDKERSALEK